MENHFSIRQSASCCIVHSFRLKLIREGMTADIVIFNEMEVKDISTFEKPHAYSKGFYFVLKSVVGDCQ